MDIGKLQNKDKLTRKKMRVKKKLEEGGSKWQLIRILDKIIF